MKEQYPHRIRLRGPWEYEPAGATARKITMPCRLSEIGLPEGPLLLRRRFGYPGRIDASESVWLTFSGIHGRAEVWLNDNRLGESDEREFAFDITALLSTRNKLEVQLIVSGADSLGEVALEIRLRSDS